MSLHLATITLWHGLPVVGPVCDALVVDPAVELLSGAGRHRVARRQHPRCRRPRGWAAGWRRWRIRHGRYPDPSTGMHLLKRARQSDGSIMGDIVPLGQLRKLVDLVPCFGKQANRQLAKETVLEYSSEFWLNKYFEKELFYAFKSI